MSSLLLFRRETGRAVFLTEDKNDFFKAMEANQSLWWKKQHLWINIGGMWAGVFLLQRNATPWKPMAQSKNSRKQTAKKKRKMETAVAPLNVAPAEVVPAGTVAAKVETVVEAGPALAVFEPAVASAEPVVAAAEEAAPAAKLPAVAAAELAEEIVSHEANIKEDI